MVGGGVGLLVVVGGRYVEGGKVLAVVGGGVGLGVVG